MGFSIGGLCARNHGVFIISTDGRRVVGYDGDLKLQASLGDQEEGSEMEAKASPLDHDRRLLLWWSMMKRSLVVVRQAIDGGDAVEMDVYLVDDNGMIRLIQTCFVGSFGAVS